jgi:hypothetical protein
LKAVVLAVILLLLLVQSGVAFNAVAADQSNPKLNRSSTVISPPTNPQTSNTVLEPYEWQEWRWWASWFLALDLPPYQNVTGPFLSSRCGNCVPVPDGTNCSGHCSAFLSAGIPNEGQYYHDTQSENRTSITVAEVMPLLLRLPAQLRQTSLGFYILDYGTWSQNGTLTPDSPEVVLGGYLRVFLNETPVPAYGRDYMVFYPPWYDTGSTITFSEIVDLTTSTLRFVWFGSATIHVVVTVDYALDCHAYTAITPTTSVTTETIQTSSIMTAPIPFLDLPAILIAILMGLFMVARKRRGR